MSSESPSSQIPSVVAAPPEQVRAFMRESERRVNEELDRLLPRPSIQDGGVAAAMRYTALAPGKRIRPILMLMASDLYHVRRATALPAACALEMVHACSLILDDLPCMDDARIRRGLAANHCVHGESTAILAAFALLNQAYGQLAEVAVEAVETVRADIGRHLSLALGTEGVIGGQALDLALDPSQLDLDQLERVHRQKTGRLFMASLEVGAILGQAPHPQRLALLDFAKNLGLAYQIQDDLLDEEGDPNQTGKSGHADPRGNFVTLAGASGARRLVTELVGCSVEYLAIFGSRASLLAGLARELIQRRR